MVRYKYITICGISCISATSIMAMKDLEESGKFACGKSRREKGKSLERRDADRKVEDKEKDMFNNYYFV